MQEYNSMMHKMFMVDYRYVHGDDRRFKTHMTYATSRKNAENNTRDMVSPERINIIKITSIPQDQEYHDRIDEAIATFKEECQLYNESRVDTEPETELF